MRSSLPLLKKKSKPLSCGIVLTANEVSLVRTFSTRSSASGEEAGGCKGLPFEDEKSSSPLMRWMSSGIFLFGSGLCLSYSTATPAFADQPSENAVSDPQKASLPSKQPIFLFKDEYRKRVFFNYEKRIRLTSPPEKVFEYFASIRSPNGEAFMTPGDLMRAVIPVFPPSESNYVRGGFLKGEKSPGDLQCPPSNFFMLFDTDNDGLISFAEYIFLVTLISIPEASFSAAFKMFDLDHNGEIDKDEFKKVMSLMRTYNRQGRQHRDGRRLGLKVSVPVENGGLIEYFFGKDGKESLQLDKFVHFLRDLQDEILRLEFAHYDHKSRGTISARDFALSMVASADMSHTTMFLNRVEELKADPQLSHVRITYQEFKCFADLRKSLRQLSFALFSHGKSNGLLTRDDFQRAASHVCGISLSKNVVDIIFHVFDLNSDGSLSCDEFLKVLQRREKDASLPRESGFKSLMACWRDCTTNCSSATIL